MCEPHQLRLPPRKKRLGGQAAARQNDKRSRIYNPERADARMSRPGGADLHGRSPPPAPPVTPPVGAQLTRGGSSPFRAQWRRSLTIHGLQKANAPSFESMEAGTYQHRRRNVIQAESIQLDQRDQQGWKPAAMRQQSAVCTKTAAETAGITKVLRGEKLFEGMDEHTMTEVVAVFERRQLRPSAVVCLEGDSANEFFVLLHGRLESSTGARPEDGEKVEGPVAFGQLALMYDCSQTATIANINANDVWVISRTTFRKTVALARAVQIDTRREFLRKVDLMINLDDHMLTQLAEALRYVNFCDGDSILNQGVEGGDKFYILEAGNVEVKRFGQVVAMLTPGDFFGERALLFNEPRGATCTAKGPVRTLRLLKGEFDSLLGSVAQAMREISTCRDAHNKKVIAGTSVRKNSDLKLAAERISTGRLKQSSAAEIEEGRHAPTATRSLEDIPRANIATIEMLAKIGEGSYGEVQLALYNDHLIAVKCLSKTKTVVSKQLQNIVYERNAMWTMDNPFILKLLGTSQSQNTLYLLLELVEGGELWFLLYESDHLAHTRIGGLDRHVSRFYATNVVAALEHIHQRGYMYRDLKPENLLIDKQGYLKVIDFGFAKLMDKPDQKSHTLCGTPEYTAPEMVLAQGHDRAVDFWALGILLYELLSMRSPFAEDVSENCDGYDENDSYCKVFYRIVHSRQKLKFHHRFPRQCKDLIVRLLNPNPVLRLGMLSGGLHDIKAMAFFAGIDWDKMTNKVYRPPCMPKGIDAKNVASMRGKVKQQSHTVPFDGDQAVFQNF